MNTERFWLSWIAVLTVFGMVLAACAAPTPQVVEKVVKETVVVEKSVEKPVPQTVVVEKSVEKLVPQTVVVEKQVPAQNMRSLKGKITVAVAGVVPVPGAPLTQRQTAWQTLLAQYKQLQPNVTVEIIDLPAGQTADKWCDAKKAAKQMPDITMLGNCEGFRPTPDEINSGLSMATDFKPFENEVNPYTGRPWKEDWLNDAVRLSRGQEGGAVNQWTDMTEWLELKMIFLNLDILKEYGYSGMPKTITELMDLSTKINKDGKYAAWDNAANRTKNFQHGMANLVGYDFWVKNGGNPDQLQINPWASFAKETELFCTQAAWGSLSPALQEVAKQGKRFMDAQGGLALILDPGRKPGQQWLQGKAAFMWETTEFQPTINQAIADGTFKVKNWTLDYLPDLTKDDLFDKSLNIGFNGKWWVEYGGQGDIWAPNAKVRATGADANVDLMVRDFFQFLSSPTGEQRIITQGTIPINPIAFQSAPKAWVDAITKWTPVTMTLYKGRTQAINPTIVENILHDAKYDSKKTIQQYYRGEMPLDQAFKQSDENATRAMVKKLNGNLKDYGLTALPAACEKWK